MMYDDYPTIYETTVDQNFIYWIILGVIIFILILVTFFSLGKIFKKANRFGISAFIPFYNILVLLEITNKPKYFFLFYLIPGFNLLFHLFTMFSLARLFRKSKWFAFGLTFFPFLFYPILAFSDSEYIGINLAAMEGKSTTIDVPKVVEEVEENPVVHEEQDEGSRNINISIGGGVYQKDYTNTLLQVDQQQTIAMEPTEPIKPENEKNSFLIAEEEPLVQENNPTNPSLFTPENQQNATTPQPTVTKTTQPTIVMPEPITINPTPISPVEVQQVVEPAPMEPVSSLSGHIETDEFVVCPNCGAKVKNDATTCFLCGHPLPEKKSSTS